METASVENIDPSGGTVLSGDDTYSTDSGGTIAVLESETSPADGSDAPARQQAAALAFGRRANARPRLAVLMQDAVALVAEMLAAELSGVSEVSPDGTRLVLKIASHGPGAAAVRPAVHELSLSADSSMAGYALNVASPVTTPDLAAEKRFADLPLRKLGVRSALSVPLHLNAQPFGALGVYRRSDRAFTAGDVEFAEMIAQLLISSIARMKAEEALQQQSAFTSTVLATVDAVVMLLDAQGNLVSLNRACEQITGFTSERVRGKPFCSVFALAEELGLVRTMLQRAINGAGGQKFESSLLTKDGLRRSVAWSLQALRNRDNFVQSIVLTGLDRTEQVETRAQLQQAKAAAKESARALGELRDGLHVGKRAAPGSAAADPGKIYGGASGGATAPSPDPPLLQPFQAMGVSKGSERRTSLRRSYQYRQRVAPVLGGRMPTAEQFVEVVCEDISVGGFSFCLSHAPTFEKLVVGLGKPPALVYFTADVAAVRKKATGGAGVFLVGCRFTGRVNIGRQDFCGGDSRRRR